MTMATWVHWLWGIGVLDVISSPMSLSMSSEVAKFWQAAPMLTRNPPSEPLRESKMVDRAPEGFGPKKSTQAVNVIESWIEVSKVEGML